MTVMVAIDARKAAVRQLTLSRDHFLAVEKRAWDEGSTAEAQGARILVTWIQRAIDAETYNRKPRRLP